MLAPDGTIFLATVSAPETRSQVTEGPHVGTMTSNIFAVDPATRAATFVATAVPSYPNWPFDASEAYVLWSDRACDADAAPRQYDRRTGVLIEVTPAPRDGGLSWPAAFTPGGVHARRRSRPAAFTPGGAIASGEFGAKALVDPESLEYLAVLPGGFADVSWSRDYRYAAVSTQLGHGGLCG